MRQQRTYSTEAIVLKRSDLGETDRILTLFTPTKGKFRVVAKGIRRPVSRKAGHLELFYRSQLHVAVGRNLDIVTQAQGLESFLHMRTSHWHMTCAFYLAELVERFIADEAEHLKVYNLLLEALRTLEIDTVEVEQQRAEGTLQPEQERDRTLLLLRYFELYLLTFIGYAPELQSCAHCHSELKPEENGFTPSLGGALCPNCSHLWTQAISKNALKVLRLFERTEWSRVPRLHLDARLHTEIESAMHGLLRFHLERDLKSWSFLEMYR
jgi:DNA repair protein RecO (recombination protein O)